MSMEQQKWNQWLSSGLCLQKSDILYKDDINRIFEISMSREYQVTIASPNGYLAVWIKTPHMLLHGLCEPLLSIPMVFTVSLKGIGVNGCLYMVMTCVPLAVQSAPTYVFVCSGAVCFGTCGSVYQRGLRNVRPGRAVRTEGTYERIDPGHQRVPEQSRSTGWNQIFTLEVTCV